VFAALAWVSAKAPAGAGAGDGAEIATAARRERMVTEENCMLMD